MNVLIKARTISSKLGICYYSGKVGVIGVPFDKGQVNMRYNESFQCPILHIS